jgi:hypothetical protein
MTAKGTCYLFAHTCWERMKDRDRHICAGPAIIRLMYTGT